MTIEQRAARVEDYPDLIRNLSTNAIINNSDRAYENRLLEIEKANLANQQYTDVIQLKKDVQEIKKLLLKITSK